MSDTAARAREQRIAEIREREMKASPDWELRGDSITRNTSGKHPNGIYVATFGCGYTSRPQSVEDAAFAAHARADIPFLLEQLAAQSAPVEEVAREQAKALFAMYQRLEFSNEKVINILADVLRQHGYGAQGQGNYHRAYQILGKALNLNQEFYGPAEMAQVAADRLTGKYDLPVEGQGVGPRCPKCGGSKLMLIPACINLVQCLNEECQGDFEMKEVVDFLQFFPSVQFSPVPSPESATKEGKNE